MLRNLCKNYFDQAAHASGLSIPCSHYIETGFLRKRLSQNEAQLTFSMLNLDISKLHFRKFYFFHRKQGFTFDSNHPAKGMA